MHPAPIFQHILLDNRHEVDQHMPHQIRDTDRLN